MSVGLIGLLDDIAAIAKVAAASLDDVASQAAKAGAKAAGVVIDDAAGHSKICDRVRGHTRATNRRQNRSRITSQQATRLASRCSGLVAFNLGCSAAFLNARVRDELLDGEIFSLASGRNRLSRAGDVTTIPSGHLHRSAIALLPQRSLSLRLPPGRLRNSISCAGQASVAHETDLKLTSNPDPAGPITPHARRCVETGRRRQDGCQLEDQNTFSSAILGSGHSCAPCPASGCAAGQCRSSGLDTRKSLHLCLSDL
jgi:hypothetical protein